MSDLPIHDRYDFDGPGLSPALRWRCEPARWGVDPAGRRLWIEPNAGTDFWSKTHYGFEADDGHFLFLTAPGDFVLTTRVSLRPVHQYDQAGLMVRISPSCWVKTSIEYEPGGPDLLGAVVTNSGYSDWSTQDVPRGTAEVWLRVRLEADDCLVDAALDGRSWRTIRTAHLLERSAAPAVDCGLYACSPRGAGFRAEFHFLDLAPGRIDASLNG